MKTLNDLKPHQVHQRRLLEKAFAQWGLTMPNEAGELIPASRSYRNKIPMTNDEIEIIRTARKAGVTPNQLELILNISAYRIHQLLNQK